MCELDYVTHCTRVLRHTRITHKSVIALRTDVSLQMCVYTEICSCICTNTRNHAHTHTHPQYLNSCILVRAHTTSISFSTCCICKMQTCTEKGTRTVGVMFSAGPVNDSFGLSLFSRLPRLSLCSLLCKSSMTSSLLNYLSVLMVIAHNRAHSPSKRRGSCTSTFTHRSTDRQQHACSKECSRFLVN